MYISILYHFYVHIQIGKWSLICHRSTSSSFAHTHTHTQTHPHTRSISFIQCDDQRTSAVEESERASRRTGLDSYAQVSICYSIHTVGNIVRRYSLWMLPLLRASSGCYSILFSLIVSYFIVTWPRYNAVRFKAQHLTTILSRSYYYYYHHSLIKLNLVICFVYNFCFLLLTLALSLPPFRSFCLFRCAFMTFGPLFGLICQTTSQRMVYLRIMKSATALNKRRNHLQSMNNNNNQKRKKITRSIFATLFFAFVSFAWLCWCSHWVYALSWIIPSGVWTFVQNAKLQR